MFSKFFGSAGDSAVFPPAPPQSPEVIAAPMRIGDPADALPPAARRKFIDICESADVAHAVLGPLREKMDELRVERMRSEARIRDLLEDRGVLTAGGENHPSVIAEGNRRDRFAEDFARFEARFAARVAAWEPLRQTADSLADYLRAHAGARFELAAPLPTPTLGKDETVAAAVARVRKQIAEVAERRLAIIDAPQPSADAKRRAREQITSLADKGRPSVMALIESARGEIGWPARVGSDRQRRDDAVALTAWLHKNQLIAAVEAEIDRRSDDASALDEATRRKKLEHADAELLQAQRIEESLIELAQSQGVTIARRREADPRAILRIIGPAPKE